jgi:hypothetical protein
VIILNILWYFGIFILVLVCCAKKNLATLHGLLAKERQQKKDEIEAWHSSV